MADQIGIKRSLLGAYEEGRADPRISNLLKFSEIFNLTVDQLIGADLATNGNSKVGERLDQDKNNLKVLSITVDRNDRENIELVPVKAQAGYTSGFADPEYISELEVFQLPFLSGEKKYRTFQLQGDSMLPIPEKAWVTGEYVLNWKELKTGEACVVLTMDDGLVFKIIENRIEQEGRLILYSLNPFYEPYEINVSQIREIWKFIHFISQEIPEPVVPENQLVRTVANLKQDIERLKLLSSDQNRHPEASPAP